MTILQAILLGIIQGITEFLPVSSSGHLAIVQNIFNVNTDGGMLFDIMLHVGTLAAVFVVYRKDIWRMIREAILICVDIVSNIKIFIRCVKANTAIAKKALENLLLYTHLKYYCSFSCVLLF